MQDALKKTAAKYDLTLWLRFHQEAIINVERPEVVGTKSQSMPWSICAQPLMLSEGSSIRARTAGVLESLALMCLKVEDDRIKVFDNWCKQH